MKLFRKSKMGSAQSIPLKMVFQSSLNHAQTGPMFLIKKNVMTAILLS
jgi:hypothetical protein